MGFCKVVRTEVVDSMSGGEMWQLTHECGKVERRVKRRRNQRHQRPAPARVRCDDKAGVAPDA
jgi:hypothetical protein